MPDDGVIDNRHIFHSTIRGMGRQGDPSDRAIADDIVSNDGIGDDLYPLAAIPNRVSLHHVWLRSAAVNKDAGVPRADIGVVNDVVSNNIAIGPRFDFDPVIAAVAGGTQVVNIISFEHAPADAAAAVVTADVNTLALRRAASVQTRMMNMITAHSKEIRIAPTDEHAVILRLGDLAVFDGNVTTSSDTNAGVATAKV